MTQIPSQGPVVQVKPQPNIYTLMIIVGIIVLAATLALVLRNLLAPVPTGYGLEIGQLFTALDKITPGR